MKTSFLLAAVLGCPLAFAQQPAAPQQQQQPTVSAAQSIINQMNIATRALADVLQGVNDKASADAAAREVGELIVQIKLLNDLAGYAPEHAQSIEAMRMAQVNALMPMLMNTTPCYGSEAMLKALAPVVTVKPAKQVQPQPEVQPQPQVQPESPSQQLAEAILEGYKDLTTVLKGVHDKATADAAAPYAAQVIATILPLYDEAEGTEGMADVVGVQIAQTQEISDLADLIENLLQAETPLYGSEALSKALAEIVTVEEAPEEEEQEAEPAEEEQPAEEEEDGEDEQELAPSEILAPVPQA